MTRKIQNSMKSKQASAAVEQIGDQDLDKISGGPVYIKVDGVSSSSSDVDAADYAIWQRNFGSTGG